MDRIDLIRILWMLISNRIKVMIVKIEFKLDLEKIIDDNSYLWCFEGRSKGEIYTELKEIFGNDLDIGMSMDAKKEYLNNFAEIFNY